MKRLLFLFAIFCALKANAQTFNITFTGTGGSTSVTTVNVENLTAGTSLSFDGYKTLHLNIIITSINSIENKKSSQIIIYPNPMTDNSVMQIYPPAEGNAIITVSDMNGKQLAQIQCYLENYLQEFRLSGINSGLYLISVKGKTYHYSGKLLCNGKSNRTISIEKVSNNIKVVDEKLNKADSKDQPPPVDMAYTTGDMLKFTGISGNYNTVITDIPTSDKIITFNFIACTDGDNNNYPIVNIGAQTWMEENLKTTKYKDGSTAIPLVTDDTDWGNLTAPGYCWYDNNEATYKATYGALYNWYSVSTGNLCPTGWHVPIDADWTILENYLIVNGYNFDGRPTDNMIAKSLASATGWTSSTNQGAVGNTDYSAKRNATGFTALPGSNRGSNGTFSGGIGRFGSWWSASWFDSVSAYGTGMSFDNWWFGVGGNDNYQYGFSVRCLKDN